MNVGQTQIQNVLTALQRRHGPPPYELGKAAYESGKARHQNPYIVGTYAYSQWQSAWMDSSREEK